MGIVKLSDNLQGAVIAAAAAILAAAAVGVTSYAVTTKQVNSAARQARDDFTRTQRQDVYVTFGADLQPFLDGLDEYNKRLPQDTLDAAGAAKMEPIVAGLEQRALSITKNFYAL